jgi:lysophospholipase L1-like esterase
MPIKPIVISLLCCALLACAVSPPASVQASPRNVEYPWMSLERWYRMHAEDVGVATRGDVGLLFVGDSITEGWPEYLMERYFGRYRPANFGIGGDRTENLLWRLQNGSVGQLQPDVISLLIGVNNFGLRDDAPEDVVLGIEAVVAELRSAFPQARIVLHGVFPYKQYAESPERVKVRQVNQAIAKLADNEHVFFLDIGPRLLEANGDLSPAIMPDFLHLSEAGYQIWADALTPLIAQLMR